MAVQEVCISSANCANHQQFEGMRTRMKTKVILTFAALCGALLLATASAAYAAEAPYGGTAAAIPGTVQAENYDTGGAAVAYNVTSTNGSDNGYRSDGVDLEVTTDTGAGVDLGWTTSGQWFKYTVNVATAGKYTVTFRVASPAAVADGLHISNSSGTNLSGSVAVPATGGYQTWTSVTASVTLPAGQQTLTVNQDAAGWNLNWFSFAAASSGEGPYGGTAAAIPGTVMASNYDTGGQGVGYSVSSTNGSANSYRSDGIDLEAATAPATGDDLGWTLAGQWFRYTVNVSTAGTYTVSILVASPTAVADGFHISNSSGTNLSGSVAIPATGGYQTWVTVTATVTLSAGTQTLTVNQDAGGWNIDSLKFATSGGGCTTKPNAPTGLAASGTTSTTTNLNWTATTAPSGCSISSYTVLKNGASIGTATGTSFAVTGLTASTNYSFTVEATDAAGTSAASSAVSVTTSAASGGEGPYPGPSAAAVPGTVMAENYDTGGQGVAYNVTSTNGTANTYRSQGVDLEAATAPATGNDLGWSAAGQWFRYTVNVSTAGSYTVSFLVASPTAVTDGFHLSNSSGTNLSGSVAVPATGGYQTWVTVKATVTLPAGTQTLTLNDDAAGWNIDSIEFASGGGSCTTKPSAPTGLAASGTTSTTTSLSWILPPPPANCSISSYTVLKNGASIGTATGNSFAVTGLTASTTYSFTVEATDAAGTSAASSAVSVTTSGGSGTNYTPAQILAAIDARMTAANQVNTEPHINTMTRALNVNVYQVAPGVFTYSSSMAIDDDGSDPDPDPDHQNQTTWQDSSGAQLGAHHVPFYVLGDDCWDNESAQGGHFATCPHFFYQNWNITGLQFALIFYNGNAIGAVFGDTQGTDVTSTSNNDSRELGEASVESAFLLGIPDSGTTGGVDSGVTVTIFSGSQWVLQGTNAGTGPVGSATGNLNGNAQALVQKALNTLGTDFAL
jgi:uncharacterized protein involved in high-affinity Fe2+ transport